MHLSLAAEPIFHIFGFPITNSMVNTWLAILFFGGFIFLLRRKEFSIVPHGVQNFFEYILDALLKIIDNVTHDRHKSEKFLPLVGTIFLFILILNWMGQLPGTGSVGFWDSQHGSLVLVPFLRPSTSDLNTTLALAIFAVLATHVFGVITVGFYKHFNKYIHLGGIWQAIKTLNPIKILLSIVNAFIGVIEIFSDIAKMLSLSLRLFGNIFAGEVLLTVIASIVAYVVPIPFMFLEILVGIVQATIFSVLTLVFLQLSTSEGH